MGDVYLNEKFIGTVEDAKKFVDKLRSERRKGDVTPLINVFYDEEFNEIYLESTKGRARRPLIIVEDGKSKLTEDIQERLKKKELTWEDLSKQGIIEYLDSSEEENALVALNEEDITKEHTHLEISPVLILGLCTSLIPYSNHGSSSRLIRGSKIQKQALGLYAANFLTRIDTESSILHYPHKPIVNTFMHDVYGYDKNPSGQNVVIALLSYEGYNMQDAIVINKASVERGFGRSTFFRPYVAEELRYSGGLMDEISVPAKDVKGYKSERDYRHLEKDGIVYSEAKVSTDDVLIGKTSPPRFLGDLEEMSIAANVRRESSTIVKHGEEGIVDTTFVTENEEGNKLVQVRLRTPRIPEIGDKFASRHGQKGVIGLIVPQENMPFSVSGIVPDLIFSPHGIPSRMTISHLIEIIAGKVGCLSGKNIDGTTFDSVPEQEIRKQLTELGFREDGTETLYNGITGEKFKARIFIGNMFYLKLKHMVANKLHARASGRIQLLTRQPIEGRAKGGGLRLGEMEKDCLVAHGTSMLLKERFDSDKTVVHVCESCGLITGYDYFKNKPTCLRCGSSAEISGIEISYAFKLLLDEVKSLGIYPKLLLKGKY